jgi:hypothetical protein
MTQPLLFDDEYTGERWTYGLSYRPLAQYNVPDGWIIYSARPNIRYAYGTVQYARRLTEQEIDRFDLTPIERNA